MNLVIKWGSARRPSKSAEANFFSKQSSHHKKRTGCVCSLWVVFSQYFASKHVESLGPKKKLIKIMKAHEVLQLLIYYSKGKETGTGI